MISRRMFLKTAGVWSALATLPQSLWSAAAASRPNIVLIIGDDISAGDHGVYGHPHIRTPNIDRLAAGGLRCKNAWLTIASCSPTRCSLITGRYPHNTGAPELHMPLPEGQVMFPQQLRQSGYYTAAIGKWHLGNYAKQAFDTVRDSRPSGAEHWVETLRNRPADKPFFMWFASHDAHRDWDQGPGAEPPETAKALVPPYQVDSPETRQDITKYMGEVQRLDRYIGDVTAELEAQGVLDNTLLIYMTDNGRAFPREKVWLYTAAFKTPFIVHWPAGLKRPGMVSDSLISIVDVAPTLLEAAGLPLPPTVQGKSFSALFQNPQATIRDYAFAEQNWHTQFIHLRALRWKHYLYIRNAAPDLSGMMMAKIERGVPSWMELLRAQKAGELTPAQANVPRRPRPEEELYDVEADPHQLTSLIENAKHKAALEHLRSVLDRWTAETGDTIPDPKTRTPDRYDRQTGQAIEGVPHSPPRRDVAGKARHSETINDPGPS